MSESNGAFGMIDSGDELGEANLLLCDFFTRDQFGSLKSRTLKREDKEDGDFLTVEYDATNGMRVGERMGVREVDGSRIEPREGLRHGVEGDTNNRFPHIVHKLNIA